MEIIRSLPTVGGFSGNSAPVALALGNFDGVHLGHQAMLRRVVDAASDLDLIPSVMTFEPTPREFFSQSAAPARLMSMRHRLESIAAAGIARIYLSRFDERLAGMEAETFVATLLEKRLNVHWLLAGDDTCFGKNRAGNFAFLRVRSNSFMLEAMATVEIEGERVSSTAVRRAVAAADFKRAGLLLGRPYTIVGRVSHGDALGRRIGFPTMNLPLKFEPVLSGVFAVRVHGLEGTDHEVREGVASLGVRPTVKAAGARPVLETHVFDFSDNTYGRRIEIEFVEKLRDEMRFADIAVLTKQIEEDARQARELFSDRACTAV